MRIFLLEDNIKRVAHFRNIFADDEILQTACIKEAIELISKDRFDIILLDHDLGEITDWRVAGTGYQVAHYLANNHTPNNQATIIVHSMNPEGSDQMMQILKAQKAYRILYTDILNKEIITARC